jgi:hypothetical protein
MGVNEAVESAEWDEGKMERRRYEREKRERKWEGEHGGYEKRRRRGREEMSGNETANKGWTKARHGIDLRCKVGMVDCLVRKSNVWLKSRDNWHTKAHHERRGWDGRDGGDGGGGDGGRGGEEEGEKQGKAEGKLEWDDKNH